MPQKTFFALALILTTLLSSGCNRIPEEPPLLATGGTLDVRRNGLGAHPDDISGYGTLTDTRPHQQNRGHT